MQRIALSRAFGIAVWWSIVLNVVVFMLKGEGRPPLMAAVLQYCNWALALCFAAELGVKVVAYHRFYFRDRWNVFDFVVTVSSLVFTGLEVASVEHPVVNSVGKAVRIARICRLVTTGPTLKVVPPPHPLAPRDALEGKAPQRRPQRRLGRRLEGVAEAVGGGYCRLQLSLRRALGVRGTVAGHRLCAPDWVGGTPPLPMHPLPPPLFLTPRPTATRCPATQCPPGQKE